MKYRIVKQISDIYYPGKKIYTDFQQAYSDCMSMSGFTWLEQKVGNKWQRMTHLEIEKAKLAYIEIKEVKLHTSTHIYRFKLPKSVMVPDNMGSDNLSLFLALKVLGIEPEVEEKEEDGLY